MVAEVAGLSGLPTGARVRVMWADGRKTSGRWGRDDGWIPMPSRIGPLYWTKEGWSHDRLHGGATPNAVFHGTAIAFGSEGVLVIEDSGWLAILPPEQLRVME